MFNINLIALILVYILNYNICHSQCTPLANALPGIKLTYVQAGGTNASGVAYNPNFNVYYAAIAGNSGFPLETFDAAGNPLYQTNTGFDMRGLWWNFNLNQLESNGYNTLGIWNYNLNASGYALNTGTLIFGGLNQPTAQSVGDYNCTDNEIWYYNAGAIMRRNRATNALIGSLAITGLPVSTANLNNNTVFYTDCVGHEIGLVDYVTKRIYFVNKTTGAYAGMSQLPASTVTNSSFRASWANGLAWLYDIGTRSWFSFQVLTGINGVCTILLPIELLNFDAEAVDNKSVLLNWTTAKEDNSNYFTIERSKDGITWEAIKDVKAAGQSTTPLSYNTVDANPFFGVSYYKLKQTSLNGQFSYSDIRAVTINRPNEEMNVYTYPNPVKSTLVIEGPSEKLLEFGIYNLLGQNISSSVIVLERTANRILVDVSNLTSGAYIIKTNSTTKKIVKQ